MQIEKLQVVLKPRSMWESADLGTQLAVRWFFPLSVSWILLALPFLLISFQFDHLLAQLVFLWWFKPLYERAVLMSLSILTFDGRLTIRAILRGFTDIRLWFYLTIFRFSWARSEHTPIDALEDLDFNAQSQRRHWLYASDSRIAFLVSLFGLLIEAIIVVALVSLFYFLTQSDFNSAYAGVLKILNINEIGKQESVFLTIAIFIAMGISAVFYVSVGFATYLDRRTIKEGWDLELGFKKIINRLGIVVFGFILVVPSVDLLANEYGDDIDETLTRVLSTPELNQSTTIRVPEHLSEYVQAMLKVEDVEPTRYRVGIGSAVMAWILRFILISALVVMIGFFFYKLYEKYGTGSASINKGGKAPPQTIRVRKLPRNVHRTIQTYWSDGQFRDALAMLYSATVVYVDATFSCDILDSDTEGDCIRKTKDIDADSRDAFRVITQTWLRLAYGNGTPSEESFQTAMRLFEQHIAPS